LSLKRSDHFGIAACRRGMSVPLTEPILGWYYTASARLLAAVPSAKTKFGLGIIEDDCRCRTALMSPQRKLGYSRFLVLLKHRARYFQQSIGY
jgi:hypothetical protein